MVKCEFCGKQEATESITDAETLKPVLICVNCDSKMSWKPDTKKLFCLQREFCAYNSFALYELEATDSENAIAEIEENVATNYSSDWLITDEDRLTLLKILSEGLSGNELNEIMIKMECKNGN